MSLITDTAGLAAFCARMAQEAFVTVDTEFMRDRTFWPRLCLVQVAGENEAVAIDALAPGIDLAPLLDLMRNPGVMTVMHAARQDLEIFFRLGQLPVTFFDTQVAAMVCGYGEEVSYETLVAKLARAQLDKSSRFTDWARRPLSEAQITYAVGDVTHLRTIYKALVAELERRGRRAWVEEELMRLCEPSNFIQEPEDGWKRLKLRTRDPRFLAIAQALAAWRDREAQRRDLPRSRIVRDDLLMEIAASRPRTVEELRGLERVSVDRDSAQGIVAAINKALALPKGELPTLPEQVQTPRGLGALIDLLRVLLKQRCDAADVAQRLVATSSDLEAIAMDDAAPVAALEGWRFEIFGQDALALKRGRLALAARGTQVAVIPIGEEAWPAF